MYIYLTLTKSADPLSEYPKKLNDNAAVAFIFRVMLTHRQKDYARYFTLCENCSFLQI